MKLRPAVFVFLLFLVSPVSFGDDLDRSNELFNKSYLVLQESKQYLEMNADLAWSFVYGSISWDYSIQEQTKILVFAKSKLEEFDRLLERYSSLDLSDTYAVKHRRGHLGSFDVFSHRCNHRAVELGCVDETAWEFLLIRCHKSHHALRLWEPGCFDWQFFYSGRRQKLC